MSWWGKLEEQAQALDSCLCVGLDPHGATTAAEALQRCLALAEATADVALAYKPNAAFFERFGADGIAALRELIRQLPPDAVVILDAKRGDIASTAEAYAEAAFDYLGADAITVSPWMGADSLAPFARRGGVFVLVRTSNPGGADLQELVQRDGTPVYEAAARLAGGFGADRAGVVVGATRPAELARVRELLPDAWILAPGVGAQGADLAATVAAGVRADGRGLLVSVSRQLSQAADPRAEAVALVSAARAARDVPRAPAVDPLLERVADGLLRLGCVRFGSFTLKSGLTSPIYLDLRRLTGEPALLADVAAAMARLVAGLPCDVLAALPYAAMPIGTALSLVTGLPMVYPRKEVKAYGTSAAVEGVYSDGQVAVVIDDLATTGSSKFEGIDRLKAAGLRVRDAVVLIDRESGAHEAMEAAGYHLHAVFTMTQLLDRWTASGAVSDGQAQQVRDFLRASRTG